MKRLSQTDQNNVGIINNDATATSKGQVQLAGDLGGTAASPTVVSTHLTSALSIAQGGTGSTTQNFVDLTSTQAKTGPLTVPVTDSGGQLFNVKAYGAAVDAKVITTGAMTSASATLTASTAVFASGDVGKLVTVAGAGTSGANLNTTIAAFVSPTQATLTASASTTVTNARVVWGTNDRSAIQSAVTAAQAAGGGTVWLPGASVCGSGTISITASGVTVAGPGYVKAALYAVTSGSSDGIITVDANGTQITNVRFHDFAVDTNSQPSKLGIVLKGGSHSTGDYLSSVQFENVYFRNLGMADVGLLHIYSGRGSTDRGPVSRVHLKHCTFDTSVKYLVYSNGGQITDHKFTYCRFINSQGGCIVFNQPNRSANINSSERSNQNWEIAYCYFNNNGVGGATGACNLIHDVQRSGILNFEIHHNYFDGYVTTVEQYVLNAHSGWGLDIHHNYFWKVRTCFAIGASNNGAYNQPNPDMVVQIKDNIFFRCYNIADHDASVFEQWEGNTFFEIQTSAIVAYARHWPSTYSRNTIYNTPTQPTPGTSYSYSPVVCNPDGLEFKGNTIIEDRLLPNPTTAPALTSVSGGSLPARTYYVVYTWANDTGETVASSEASISLAANTLLNAAMPTSVATYGVPTGAKLVKWYVSTTSGAETYQGYSASPWQWETETLAGSTLPAGVQSFTEPTTGIATGAALPTSNTTSAQCLYGYYELSGAGQLPNHYEDNKFYGVGTEIFKLSSAKRVQRNNWTNRTFATGAEQLLEKVPYAQGNITGATTFDVGNGEVIVATVTGNVTGTLSSGHWVGQVLERRFTMGGSGSYSYTPGANEKLQGGGFPLSSTVGSLDALIQTWDGTNWIEASRNLAAGAAASATWGSITGTLSSQTDLQTALNSKATKAYATAMAVALGG